MSAKVQTNACCTYDFTLHKTESTKDEKDIIAILKEHCKKWAFQLEVGELSKLEHYQGRFSLKVKKRIHQVVTLVNLGHLSITSKGNAGNDFYVTKEDTRVLGPWTDQNEPMYIPRDVREMITLLPWQQSMYEISKVYQPRVIHYIYNENGNIGKTCFSRWMFCHGHGQIIPFANDFKDVMRMVMDMPEAKTYMLDMPRAITKEKLFQLYSGIEMVKSGYAYDDRYSFKQKCFDPPNIIVFSNSKPDYSLLTSDRWNMLTIGSDSKLYRYKEESP